MKKIIFSFLFTIIGPVSMTSNLYALTPYDKDNSQPLLMYGFEFGASIPLTKNYSPDDLLSKMLAGNFGAFIRIGKHVYGELGVGYTFLKGTYTATLPNVVLTEIVETRYLQIPLKAVWNIPFKKNYAFLYSVGIKYQPLIFVSNNHIFYTKENITKHPFSFMGGIKFRAYFFIFDITYQQFLQKFFLKSNAKKPSFLNISLGFQLQ